MSVDNDSMRKIELQNDANLIVKLRTVTRPTQSEMDEIYYLMKKYVNKDASQYCATCTQPMNSIQRYWFAIIGLDINNLQPL